MGCFQSKPGAADAGAQKIRLTKPVWKSEQPITGDELKTMRETFWMTQPHYAGAQEIWTALKAACEAEDPETARLIVEAAGVIVKKWPQECWDERGAEYELPNYVVSEPTNLIRS